MNQTRSYPRTFLIKLLPWISLLFFYYLRGWPVRLDQPYHGLLPGIEISLVYLCALSMGWHQLRWNRPIIIVLQLLVLAGITLAFRPLASIATVLVDSSTAGFYLFLFLQFLFAFNFKAVHSVAYAASAVVVGGLTFFSPSQDALARYELTILFLSPYLAGSLSSTLISGLPLKSQDDMTSRNEGIRSENMPLLVHRIISSSMLVLIGIITASNVCFSSMDGCLVYFPHIGNLSFSFAIAGVAVFIAGNRLRLPWPVALLTLALLPWVWLLTKAGVVGLVNDYVSELAGISESFISFTADIVLATFALFIWLLVINFHNKYLAVSGGLMLIVVWLFWNSYFSFIPRDELAFILFAFTLVLSLWRRSGSPEADIQGYGLPHSMHNLITQLTVGRFQGTRS